MKRPIDLQGLLSEVRDEIIRATATFRPFASSHEGYAILREEVDELWDAIKANNLRDARAEAVKVAAMAIRFLMDVTEQSQADNTVDGRPK